MSLKRTLVLVILGTCLVAAPATIAGAPAAESTAGAAADPVSERPADVRFGEGAVPTVSALVEVDRGYVAVGQVRSDPRMQPVAWGVTENWTVRWRTPLQTRVTSVTDATGDGDGGVVLTGFRGHSVNAEPGEETAYLARVNATGDVVWEKQYASNRTTSPYSVVQYRDGYALAGRTHRETAGGLPRAGWLARVEANGTLAWHRSLSPTRAGFDGPAFADLAVVDGDLLAAGNVHVAGSGLQSDRPTRPWLVRVDAAGEPTRRTLVAELNGSTRVDEVAVSPDGTPVFAGSTGPTEGGEASLFVARGSLSDPAWVRATRLDDAVDVQSLHWNGTDSLALGATVYGETPVSLSPFVLRLRADGSTTGVARPPALTSLVSLAPTDTGPVALGLHDLDNEGPRLWLGPVDATRSIRLQRSFPDIETGTTTATTATTATTVDRTREEPTAPTPRTSTASPTATPSTTSGGQPGLGTLASLLAVAGLSALLAARR